MANPVREDLLRTSWIDPYGCRSPIGARSCPRLSIAGTSSASSSSLSLAFALGPLLCRVLGQSHVTLAWEPGRLIGGDLKLGESTVRLDELRYLRQALPYHWIESYDEATANLLDNIPGTVFTAGDNAYESGTLSEFNSYYHPSWGRHKARTLPSVGNHEYNIDGSDASGYFDYFGAAAGERGKGYYSYNRGDWHIIALNSMCASSASISCDETAQLTWLKNDLAANPTRCTMAYFHHPLFSSGVHGDTQPGGDDSHVVGWVKPLWDALYAADADVIVNGHDHNYERFAPQNPSGVADPARGIREFIVGTGGTTLRPIQSKKVNSEQFNSAAYGVLKLTLNSTSYDWEFVPVAGKTFTDSGSDSCH